MKQYVRVMGYLAILLSTCLIYVSVGAVYISPNMIIGSLISWGRWLIEGGTTIPTDANNEFILWSIRLPRLIYAALAGSGLSLAGLCMQTLTRNVLADPYILGVSAGASTGAVFAIVVGGWSALGYYNVPVFAFIGAGLATMAVLFCVRNSHSQVKLILVGAGMSGLFSALTMVIIYGAKHEAQVRSAMFWMLGSLSGIQWADIPISAIVVLVYALVIFVLGHDLDILGLGDEEAFHLGMSVQYMRVLLVIITSFTIALLVSNIGVVGFIGLIVPHMARFTGRYTHRKSVLLVAFIGAVVMIWADMMARYLYRPEEIPIGVLTSLVGAPVFIGLVMKRYHYEERL